MNNALATQTKEDRSALIEVLGSSLYVGAKKESIGMVIDYCSATGLNPMQKPVHIVPMNTRNPVTNEYEWRDVIMPGIGHYRIQADRSKTMAGISEPEFGSEVTRVFKDKNNKDVECTFPEWCTVRVKKVVGEHIVEFVAKEYWIENYATDSGKSEAPNAMWRKRPRGQIAKCAEAQALRKAFPEVGAQPTAEEMEGKVIDADFTALPHQSTPETDFISDQRFDELFPQWREIVLSGKKTPAELIDFLSGKGINLSEDQTAAIKAVDTFAEKEEA